MRHAGRSTVRPIAPGTAFAVTRLFFSQQGAGIRQGLLGCDPVGRRIAVAF
jgi:hypothetical protein